MDQPVILSAVRTPIGKFMGGLSPLSAPELGAKVVTEVVRRAGTGRKSHSDKTIARSISPCVVMASTQASIRS